MPVQPQEHPRWAHRAREGREKSVVLVALGGVVASRFFGKSRDDANDDTQGDNKITRFLFGAANAGDYTDASTMVSEDFKAYTNGHQLGNKGVTEGPDLLTEALHYYDQNIGDSFWQLYDEVDQVDRHGSGMIAIRFLAKGKFSGDEKEIEMAGFLTVAKHKLDELRFVTDLSAFNHMRKAAGLPVLD
jgi:hypothetical protein